MFLNAPVHLAKHDNRVLLVQLEDCGHRILLSLRLKAEHRANANQCQDPFPHNGFGHHQLVASSSTQWIALLPPRHVR